MFLSKNRMAKMSEKSIVERYSKYLQRVAIVAPDRVDVKESNVHDSHFLSYNEFKDYHILGLVGKGEDEFIDKLVFVIQRLRKDQGY